MRHHVGRPQEPHSTLYIDTSGLLNRGGVTEALSLTYGTDGQGLRWALLTALRLCLIAFSLAARVAIIALRRHVVTLLTPGRFLPRTWRQGGYSRKEVGS